MRIHFIAILFVISIFVSCKKKDVPAPVTIQAQTLLNVSYGSDPQQTMDAYLPAGRSAASTKVMILIHGGGWNSGDKMDFSVYVDSLRKRDPSYAVFNINYRLSTGSANFFPTQENDVKAAVEFIYNKRTEYLITDKFVVVGGSAGGHLALLQGYKYTLPVKVKAVVDFFGPADLTDSYNNPANPFVPLLLVSVTGGNPTTHAVLYQQSSPVSFVTPQSPPTLIFHGGLDIVVSPSQSVLLKDKLQANGVTYQYVFYPAEGHGWVGSALTDSFNKIAAFLAANVN